MTMGKIPQNIEDFLVHYQGENKFTFDILGCADCEACIINKKACHECIEKNRSLLKNVLKYQPKSLENGSKTYQ